MINTAVPSWSTTPTPRAPHGNRAFRAAGVALRYDWLPWQLHANRIISERRIDDPRRYRWPLVVICVPRQAGKTSALAGTLTTRTLREPRHLAFYTAQTGKDARERHTDLVKRINDSPLKAFMQHVKRAGAESIVWPNGSEIRAFAPTMSSLHGYTPPTVVLDEAWYHSLSAGTDLLGAIMPAQQTLPNRQLVIVSTMGDARSDWFHDLVAQGRESVSNPDSDMAYIEYSADPSSDLYSPANWFTFHPALGYRDLTVEALQEIADRLSPGEWSRAICNVATRVTVSIVPASDWSALGDQLTPPAAGVALAYDVAFDRSQASIVAAWSTPAGPRMLPVYSAPGIDWLPAKLVEVAERVGPAVIGCHDGEPTREVTDQIRRARILTRFATAQQTDTDAGVTAIPDRAFATATGAMLGYARSTPATLRHSGDDVLLQAMSNAVLRPLGDGFALSRRHSRGPIDALVAGTVAIRLAETIPAAAGRPLIHFS